MNNIKEIYIMGKIKDIIMGKNVYNIDESRNQR